MQYRGRVRLNTDYSAPSTSQPHLLIHETYSSNNHDYVHRDIRWDNIIIERFPMEPSQRGEREVK